MGRNDSNYEHVTGNRARATTMAQMVLNRHETDGIFFYSLPFSIPTFEKSRLFAWGWSPNNLGSASHFELPAIRIAYGLVCLWSTFVRTEAFIRLVRDENFLRKRRKQKQCAMNKLDSDECFLLLIQLTWHVSMCRACVRRVGNSMQSCRKIWKWSASPVPESARMMLIWSFWAID